MGCSLKRSLKIFTLMTSHSRRSLRFSRRPKAMPIWPRSSSRKWEKAQFSLHPANSSRCLFKMMTRKTFTHESTSSELEIYISNHRQTRHHREYGEMANKVKKYMADRVATLVATASSIGCVNDQVNVLCLKTFKVIIKNLKLK